MFIVRCDSFKLVRLEPQNLTNLKWITTDCKHCLYIFNQKKKSVRLDLEYVMTYSNKLTCITISFIDNKLYETSVFFFFSRKLVLYKFKCEK